MGAAGSAFGLTGKLEKCETERKKRKVEHVEKKHHRLLTLLCIYMIAIVVGIITFIIIPDLKVHGIIFYAVVILGLLKYIKREKCDWRKWFSKIEEGVGRIILMIIVVALVLVVDFILQIALCYIGEAEPFQFNIFTYLATGFLAPVTEEIVCRGMIVDILQEKHKNIFVVLVSSLIFYVIHGNPMNIGAFIFGIFTSFTVLKTKNIVPGMIVHSIWNHVVYFLPLIGQMVLLAFKE